MLDGVSTWAGIVNNISNCGVQTRDFLYLEKQSRDEYAETEHIYGG